MPKDNGKESFKGEKEWDRRNTEPGGGQLLRVKGARIDDHRDALKDVREKQRRSEQKNNPGSSMKR